MKGKKNFRVVARDYALTYPKCEVLPEVALGYFKERFIAKYSYLAVVRESHADGSYHLHAQLQFKVDFNCTSEKTFDLKFGDVVSHPNIQKTADSEDWNAYLHKSGTPLSEGSFEGLAFRSKKKKKAEAQDKSLLRAQDNMKIINTELNELVKDGTVSMYQYCNLYKAKMLFKQNEMKLTAIYPRKCYWIYGEPGIGKSYWVRSNYPSTYVKPNNKWWDGYVDQAVVLIDDFDNQHLMHYMKIWADSYTFTAEVKNGSMMPSYTMLFVTSNYMPDDGKLIGQDSVLGKAVSRRFVLCTIEEYQLVDFYTKEKIEIGK